MSEISTDGIRGSAEDIFCVTAMHRDAGRNPGQDFSSLVEDEKKEEKDGKEKSSGGNRFSEVVDGVLLSDKAVVSSGQDAIAGNAGESDSDVVPGKPSEGATPPGSLINLMA